ncbi:MAG: bifunctional 2-methylcitrate dehydratase/aconitate hydratase [Proteobacteria bacterium]|nr:bifunctional 2-methylcitrate dehydratase/aconitate hydratase [Pseudomonadota bacterium]
MSLEVISNKRPEFDAEIIKIADYICNYSIDSELAYETAYYDLLDSFACALMALKFPDCTKLLGPVVPKAVLKNGAKIPGTAYRLEPVQAAFNFGAMIRWLDYNDTWLAAEWGHPSDNLGGLCTLMDYLNRQRPNHTKYTMHNLLTAMIKAHEVQGVIALENSFNRVGLDHVVLVKVATAGVAAHLLGGDREKVCNSLSQAWLDGQSLRTYRHAPNTGSRKSWAAGDATSRGVRLALLSLAGEPGYPSVLSAKRWGVYDVYFQGKPLTFKRPFQSYIMENILFKIAFPAEFHAQTAAEAAIQLFPQVQGRWQEIDKIKVTTQESAMRIINKQGPLYSPADRDHCLQYVIAVGLLFGKLTAESYQDQTAKDPRIDQLREKMVVVENPEFSKNYLDADKRSIGNSIQVFFKDGSSTELLAIEYPIGHRRRRAEGIPHLMKKFSDSVQAHFPSEQAEKIIALAKNRKKLLKMLVHKWNDLWFF